MTQEMWGLDVEQVKNLARILDRAAGQLEDVRRDTNQTVAHVRGAGPNIDRFKSRWLSDLGPAVGTAAEALRSAGKKAAKNAEMQAGTSENYSGSGGGGGGGGGPLGWLKDRAGDLWDAGKKGVDWVGDTVKDGVDTVTDTVKDGASWVGDKVTDIGGWFGDRAEDVADGVKEGVDWAGDRVSDAGDWLGDRASDLGGWFADRGEGIVESADEWENVLDAGGQLWDATGGSILDGRWPRTTEVVASGLLVTGAFGAAGFSTVTGKETSFFDDGDPYAGQPRPVGEATVPDSLDDLTRSVTDAYGNDGTVRVTTVEGPNGPRVIVSVPGTEEWVKTGDNPMDLTGNLVTAGGGHSTMTQAVELAMANANIPPGAEVLMVGHSQGGMTVADLASNPDFVSEYNVTNAVTFGSPIDSEHIDPRVNVLEMQHQTDVVPRLDMGDSLYVPSLNPLAPLAPMMPGLPSGYEQSGPGHTTVTLPNPEGVSWTDPAGAHDHRNYSNSISGSKDPALAQYEQQLRDSGFLLPEASTDTERARNDAASSTVEISVGRRQ